METPMLMVGDNPPRKMSRLRIPGMTCLVFTSILGMILVMFSLTAMGSGKPHSSPSHGQAAQATITSTKTVLITTQLPSPSTSLPDYFQTKPEVLPGPTAPASSRPFLAQTNPAPFPSVSYTPPSPIETSYHVQGGSDNIFHYMGHLSPYFASPGFNIDEFALPPGANITHAHLLHRHGSRYPTSDSTVTRFAARLATAPKTFTGPLTFLNTWTYNLGAERLVALGRNELFSSGVTHFYAYGSLASTSKILVRTTSQDRMLQSAATFLSGFFGANWPQNATLMPILEGPGLNNSLAAYFACPNNLNFRSLGGENASVFWQDVFLADATKRLRAYSGEYNWTTRDSYDAMTLCPYETVAFGYSRFCDLFTLDEWKGFEYSIDLMFAGSVGRISPTGRAVGIGFVEELRARLRGRVYELPDGATGANATLDRSRETFPLDQRVYLDFSHDTNIYAVLTAMGLLGGMLSNSSMSERVPVSHVTPFGARVVWEQITTPRPVKALRGDDVYEHGGETEYMHMLVGQRTVPLGDYHPECGKRIDGWCEMNVFMKILDGLLVKAKYEQSCAGDYEAPAWGDITDGVPTEKAG